MPTIFDIPSDALSKIKEFPNLQEQESKIYMRRFNKLLDDYRYTIEDAHKLCTRSIGTSEALFKKSLNKSILNERNDLIAAAKYRSPAMLKRLTAEPKPKKIATTPDPLPPMFEQ